METPVSAILADLHIKPKHVLINRVPLYDGTAFFTVRDLPPLTLVYRVFNRSEFIGSISALGYELVDSWEIVEHDCGKCLIPFHPEKSVRAYSGLYFRLIK